MNKRSEQYLHPSGARHIALLVCILLAAFIYGGWRLKRQPTTAPPATATALLEETAAKAVNDIPPVTPAKKVPTVKISAPRRADFAAELPPLPITPSATTSEKPSRATPLPDLLAALPPAPPTTVAPPPPALTAVAPPELPPLPSEPAAPPLTVAPIAALPTTATATIQPPETTGQRYYAVKRGDTLTRIASSELGDAQMAARIFSLNRKQLASPDQLRVGMRLQLPATLTATSARLHRARAGETLAGLAMRYYGEVSPKHLAALRQANPTISKSALQAGAQIVIPGETLRRQPKATGKPRAAGEFFAPTPQTATIYTVRAGDSLSRIATQRLGRASRWREIYELNRQTLKSPSALRPGMRLQLPAQ